MLLLAPLLLSVSVVMLLVQMTNGQKGCSNPIAKLFDEVQVMGTAQPYNLTSIECKDILDYNCCQTKYYVYISVNFYEQKANTLDWWNKYLLPSMNTFVDNYKDFLTWYSINEAVLDSTKSTQEVEYLRSIVNGLTAQKKRCFEKIWKHVATMKCLVCSSDYKEYFKMLRNRTIEMYLDENMCQVIQEECTDYAKNFVEVAEKSRYLFEWVKNSLGVPSYSDEELLNITSYYTYTDSMYNCRSTGLCRRLCDKFVTAKGFSQNFTIPDIVYLEWFSDNFRALKKIKAGSRRLLEHRRSNGNALGELKFGSVVNYDNCSFETNLAWSSESHAARVEELDFRIASRDSENPSRRRLASTTTSSYAELKKLMSSYASSPKYSNSYTFNTFTVFNKVQNMTSEDEYQWGGRLKAPTILTLLLLSLTFLMN